MNLRLNANAIVTNEKGEILIVKLKKGPYAGGLCIPGGGINAGEHSRETIKREIKEETGIEISGEIKNFGVCELINPKNQNHRIVLLLHASGKGVPKETDEAVAQWMDAKDIEKNAIPFAKESLRIWKENKPYFCLVDDVPLK